MRLPLNSLRKIPSTEFLNWESLRLRSISGVSTDSRTLGPGSLFVALRGNNFDGHAFVNEAFAAGAVAAMVDRRYVPGNDKTWPLIVVNDTTRCLGAIAQIYRKTFSIPVLAVAGSNGKTTSKEMIARVLAEKYRVLSTEGNLNNYVGVPQTLFRITRNDEVAVVEIGTNHPGEIAHLCQIVEPTDGIVTNIGNEHLEFFGSIQGVAKEEGELFNFLTAVRRGRAIVNADDPLVVKSALHVNRKVTYGFNSPNSSLRGRKISLNKMGNASFEFKGNRMTKWLPVKLSIPGAHNAINALSAAAVGVAFGVPADRIRTALESCRASGKRMEPIVIGEVLILNDTYNANPDSVRASLKTLAALQRGGKKIAVLADMKELGEQAKENHLSIGKQVAALGIDYLLTFGPSAKWIHEAADIPGAIHYEQKNVLAEYLAELVAPGDSVLVKGSRGMKMEDIILFLEQRLKSRA